MELTANYHHCTLLLNRLNFLHKSTYPEVNSEYYKYLVVDCILFACLCFVVICIVCDAFNMIERSEFKNAVRIHLDSCKRICDNLSFSFIQFVCKLRNTGYWLCLFVCLTGRP